MQMSRFESQRQELAQEARVALETLIEAMPASVREEPILDGQGVLYIERRISTRP